MMTAGIPGPGGSDCFKRRKVLQELNGPVQTSGLRRQFELDSSWKPSKNLSLQVYHTGDTEIYLNNRLVAELEKSSSGYTQVDLEPSASKALLIGTNVLSVHCAQKRVSELY